MSRQRALAVPCVMGMIGSWIIASSSTPAPFELKRCRAPRGGGSGAAAGVLVAGTQRALGRRASLCRSPGLAGRLVFGAVPKVNAVVKLRSPSAPLIAR